MLDYTAAIRDKCIDYFLHILNQRITSGETDFYFPNKKGGNYVFFTPLLY